MRTTKIIISLLVLSLMFFVCVPGISAYTLRAPDDDSPTLTIREDINDDLYAAGGNIIVDSAIKGDLLCAGSTIDFMGNVSDSLFLAGGNITADGKVGKDARIAGGTIILSGDIGEDLLVFSGTAKLNKGKVGGDLLASAGTVQLSMPVSGKAMINAGDVFIDAPINGNVQINADSISFGSKGRINGSLTYTSPDTVKNIDDKVKGKVTYHEAAQDGKEKGRGAAGGFAALVFLMLIGGLIRLIGLYILALLFIFLLPAFSKRMVQERNYWAEVGIGFAVLIFGPPAIITLFMTIIGWGLAIIVLLAYLAALMVATVFAAIIAGSLLRKLLFSKEELEATPLDAIIGLVVLILLGFIPVIGWLIWFVFFLIALGRLVTVIWEKWNVSKIEKASSK